MGATRAGHGINVSRKQAPGDTFQHQITIRTAILELFGGDFHLLRDLISKVERVDLEATAEA
jgi:hypothetical protein